MSYLFLRGMFVSKTILRGNHESDNSWVYNYHFGCRTTAWDALIV